MSSSASKVSIPVWIGLGAVTWALLLLVLWAIHPVPGVATVVPVDDPSAAERASIDQLYAGFDVMPAKLIERFECDSTPLQAATGSADDSSAPRLEAGFEYRNPPCSGEYDAARAAFWVNILAVAAVITASVAFTLRQSKKSSGNDAQQMSSDVMAIADSTD